MENTSKSPPATSTSDAQSVQTARTSRKRREREEKLKEVAMSVGDLKRLAANKGTPTPSTRSSVDQIRYMGLKEQEKRTEELSRNHFGMQLNYRLECERNAKLRDLLEETTKELEESQTEVGDMKKELGVANKKISDLEFINERLHETLEIQDTVIEDARLVNDSFQERFKEMKLAIEESRDASLIEEGSAHRDDPSQPEDNGVDLDAVRSAFLAPVTKIKGEAPLGATKSMTTIIDNETQGPSEQSTSDREANKDNEAKDEDNGVNDYNEDKDGAQSDSLPDPPDSSASDVESIYGYIRGTPPHENAPMPPTPVTTPAPKIRHNAARLLDRALNAADCFLQASELLDSPQTSYPSFQTQLPTPEQTPLKPVFETTYTPNYDEDLLSDVLPPSDTFFFESSLSTARSLAISRCFSPLSVVLASASGSTYATAQTPQLPHRNQTQTFLLPPSPVLSSIWNGLDEEYGGSGIEKTADEVVKGSKISPHGLLDEDWVAVQDYEEMLQNQRENGWLTVAKKLPKSSEVLKESKELEGKCTACAVKKEEEEDEEMEKECEDALSPPYPSTITQYLRKI